MYEFEVYQGKDQTKAEEEIPGLLMTVNVVHRLTQQRIKGTKFFFDNYFSSKELLKRLKCDGLLAIGTIRKDRMEGAEKILVAPADLKKRGRGSYDFAVEGNSGLTMIRWYDNSDVQLISNYVGEKLGNPARRWSKQKNDYIEIDTRNG